MAWNQLQSTLAPCEWRTNSSTLLWMASRLGCVGAWRVRLWPRLPWYGDLSAHHRRYERLVGLSGLSGGHDPLSCGRSDYASPRYSVSQVRRRSDNEAWRPHARFGGARLGYG